MLLAIMLGSRQGCVYKLFYFACKTYHAVLCCQSKFSFFFGEHIMDTSHVVARLRELRIVPVLAVDSVEQGLQICAALRAGGLPAAEITFRTAAAAETIRQASAQFPEMLLGAGTILNEKDLRTSQEAGAKFAVAPGCNPRIVAAAQSHGLPFLPGVATPSDIECALSLGVTAMKFFPAEALGGAKTLKAVAAPYRHLGVQFMPTGGVNLKNLCDYLAIPEVAAVGGTWLATSDLLKNSDWDGIAAAVRTAVALAQGGQQ
jgi:2-dehydro-3-deoxyphosphogluconate aldolase/(4S)-4-hydroxy-2-oxoglutarate aldolase